MHRPILIIGACGQIGTELTIVLRDKYGAENVIASDIREGGEALMQSGPFELMDATDYAAVEDVVMHYEIDEVYLMGRHAERHGGEIPNAGLEPQHEFAFQCAQPGQGKENFQGFLAFQHCCFRTQHPKGAYTAAHHYGTQYRLRDQ